MTEHHCPGHPGLADELRDYLTGTLEALEPLLARLRDRAASGSEPTAPCATCPLCALIAVLRGERSELAARLAEQAAGLLAVLRAALEEGAGAPATPAPAAAPSSSGPRVRKIEIMSDPTGDAAAC